MWPREHGALVGTCPNGHVALGARGSGSTQLCSEHGGTLMMSWISWPEPRRRVVDVLQRVEEKGLLGLEYCLGGCGLDELWSWTSWTLSLVLGCTCARSERIHSLIGDVWPGEWAVILDSIQTRGLDQDETLPPWWVLVGVGRKSDGEAGNVCIKGDAAAYTPEACAAPVPGILRGRILGRLRIRGMRMFNKTRKPKLKILMLDPDGLACAS
ncbi:hypothetical protein F2Q69_00023081 [Brassica cretica]|uniref:Uncharacterized protein n=1 Tax=Brassica cretica TaxID=69181 RepID=A0A8S9QFB5_BRACR|nr:hypothetical protein F2Q69_00023081 [Brassica cretica]